MFRKINKHIVQSLLALPRRYKQVLLLFSDALFVLLALWLAFTLRLDQLYWPSSEHYVLFVLAICIALPVFSLFSMYRAVIRYVSYHALSTIFKAVTVYGVLLAFGAFLLRVPDVPRSVPIINIILLVIMVGSIRMLARAILTRYSSFKGRSKKNHARTSNAILIYGAGDAGIQLASAIEHDSKYNLMGFVDNRKSVQKQIISGTRVYAPQQLKLVIGKYNVATVLIAIPSMSAKRRKQLIDTLEPFKVKIRIVPKLADLTDGKLTLQDIRDVSTEDLLGRDVVEPVTRLLTKDVSNKTVLVTGAGGSIGSEICRQLLQVNPMCLLLLDNSEENLYHIEQEIRQTFPETDCRYILCSVMDRKKLASLFALHKIDTIYHAAAYKHVPIVESNPISGVQNNVIGTWNVASAAQQAQVSKFVLVSTDKAVRPTNIMGASKRIAEMVLQALANEDKRSSGKGEERATIFTMVRFGNVLGSSGSVVPLFQKQIRKGGPVTVTDEKITRYFMSIPEAAQLVIQAGAMAKGGEVFLLDMGTPVEILELAKKFIRLSGKEYTLDENAADEQTVQIKITGLRPGEKLYEELLIDKDAYPTEHVMIMKGMETFLPWSELQPDIEKIDGLCFSDSNERLSRLVHRLVPGYHKEDKSNVIPLKPLEPKQA